MLHFNQSRDDGMAVASAGPFANHLHLAPDRQPRQYGTITLTYSKAYWRLFHFADDIHNHKGALWPPWQYNVPPMLRPYLRKRLSLCHKI